MQYIPVCSFWGGPHGVLNGCEPLLPALLQRYNIIIKLNIQFLARGNAPLIPNHPTQFH